MLYGGYPGVFVEPDSVLKKKKLSEIAESYITRDVVNLFGIKNIDAVRLIASFLGENLGGLLSRENVSKLAGVSKYETEKILNSLQKTFIIFKIVPFARGGVRELIHRPKVYFFDVGIRNALLAKLEDYLLVADRGKLFENVIALRLFGKHGLSNIRFWRTSNKTEVDFIVKKQGKIIAYECKYASSRTSTRGLGNFQKRYHELIEDVFVLTKDNYWKV
jgi:predicted AAA+ superfamily ATPase